MIPRRQDQLAPRRMRRPQRHGLRQPLDQRCHLRPRKVYAETRGELPHAAGRLLAAVAKAIARLAPRNRIAPHALGFLLADWVLNSGLLHRDLATHVETGHDAEPLFPVLVFMER